MRRGASYIDIIKVCMLMYTFFRQSAMYKRLLTQAQSSLPQNLLVLL